MYIFHIKIIHSAWNNLKNNFDNNHIYFNNYSNYLREYVNNCPICIHRSKNTKNPPKVKPIIVNGPKIRYVIDITFLKDDLRESLKCDSISSIIDQFSRFGYIYQLKNKETSTVLKKIKKFLSIIGNPKEFGFDNGKEFKNKLLEEYCKEENIDIIHGIPYMPHSQGTVERFHLKNQETYRKYLCRIRI